MNVVCATAQVVPRVRSVRHTYERQACVWHIKHAYSASEHVSHQLCADAVMQQGSPVSSALDVEHDEFV